MGTTATVGKGLSLREGPPRTAFGGPPILGCLLLRFGNGWPDDCCPTKGGGGPSITEGRGKWPVTGVKALSG